MVKQDKGRVTGRGECQLLTVKDVASILAIAPRSVWRLSATGQLARPLRLGAKTLRWRLRDIQRYLAELEEQRCATIAG